MKKRRISMYIPVLLVLIMSIPLVYISQYDDFQRSRDLSREVTDNSGTFKGFTEDTSTTVSIVPDRVIDNTIKGNKEKINVTDSSGNISTIEQDTPKRSLLGGFLNALLMVSIAIVAAFGIYKLFIKRKRVTLKLFFAGALGLCASVSIMLYLYLFRNFMESAFAIHVNSTYLFYTSITAMGAIAGGYIVYNMVFRSMDPKRKNPSLVAFCILLGAFLAIVLPVWAVIPLITGVALWDLWAAKRGIIKDMITESDKDRDEFRRKDEERLKQQANESAISLHIPGSVKESPQVVKERKKLFSVQPGEDITSYGLYEGKYYALGIGDFIFFSVLVSATFKWMMLKIPWMDFYVPVWGEIVIGLSTAIVIGLVILGLKKTLGYLDKEHVMPGLPLSVLFGLIGFFGVVIFLQVVNVIFFGNIVNPF